MKIIYNLVITIILFFTCCKKESKGVFEPSIIIRGTSPVFAPVYITLWDSAGNKPYFTSFPDTAIKLYHYSVSFNPILEYDTLIQKKNILKFVNILDVSDIGTTYQLTRINKYYLKFPNGDIDTIFIDYFLEESSTYQYIIKTFLYNNVAIKKDIVTSVYEVNK